jgi:hypothetical protein
MNIVIHDLGGYSRITVCYHNGINRVKTVTIIFTFHVGLQINVQFFDESRGDFCRVLARRVRRHTRTHTTILSEGFRKSYFILNNMSLFLYSHLEHRL